MGAKRVEKFLTQRKQNKPATPLVAAGQENDTRKVSFQFIATNH